MIIEFRHKNIINKQENTKHFNQKYKMESRNTHSESGETEWLQEDVTLVVCRVSCLFQKNVHGQCKEGLLTVRTVQLLQNVNDALIHGQALEL